jgi:hypothetical protein
VSEYSGVPARRRTCLEGHGAGTPLRERTIGDGPLAAPTSASEEAS